ncbi:MAG: hypothetical protein D6795_13560, partial [Deltaproteobacteria bacterium]
MTPVGILRPRCTRGCPPILTPRVGFVPGRKARFAGITVSLGILLLLGVLAGCSTPPSPPHE